MSLVKALKDKAYSRRAVGLPLGLFAAALLPRLLGLNIFLTADENLWLGRSRDFLAGLLKQEWSQTLQTGHPGVATMWTGSLGILYRYWTRLPGEADDLLTFVENVSHEPPSLSYIGPVRLPTVLLTALFVVLFYFLVSRLFADRRIGLAAALLVALDPFHIALSRVLHHDALASVFMTLALLPLLGYWLQDWQRRWLVFSGATAGLAFLSKSPALFLMPFCALLGLIWAGQRWRSGQWRGWPDGGRFAGGGLGWGLVAWATVFIGWPAMWVNPLETVLTVVGLSRQYAAEGHYFGNFFLGQVTRDPSPWFYPINWLFRATPLALAGLLAGGGASLYRRFKQPETERDRSTTARLVLASLLYVVLFVIFMSFGAKKQDRYILPIFPVLSMVAAWGLIRLFDLCRRSNRPDLAENRPAGNTPAVNPKIGFKGGRLIGSLIGLGLAWQVGLVIGHYPYYFTYYNPWLGGITAATKVTTVGWGEGLDQAAAYLNGLPAAEELRVLAWYPFAFAPFFEGQTVGYLEILSSDYIVLYHSQVQRGELADGALEYFLRHRPPNFTVTLKGVEYAYIYRLPMSRRGTWEVSGLPDKVFLLGVSEGRRPHTLRLHWRNLGLPAEEKWWLTLQAAGSTQPWTACRLGPAFAGERLAAGLVLESECQLAADNLPTGLYHLRLGVGASPSNITPVAFPAGETAVKVEADGKPYLLP